MNHSGATSEDLGLGDYLSILRRRWGWIAVSMFVFGGLATAIALRADPTYVASAQVLLADSAAQSAVDPSSQNLAFRDREIANELSITSSDEFDSQLDAATDGAVDLAVAAGNESDTITFTATAGSPERAAEHANAAAAVYVAIKQQSASESITSAVDQFRERLTELREQREDVVQPLTDIEDRIAITTDPVRLTELDRQYRRAETAIEPELTLIDAEVASIADSITKLQLNGELASSGTARIIQEAVEPANSSNTSAVSALVIGSLLGLVVGITLAFAAESLDTTIKSIDDLERHFSLPVLATVPRGTDDKAGDPALAVADTNTSDIADGYHRLRSSLQFILASESVGTIVVTSANPAEGKTTTSSNLAWAMAAIGRRVLLADVDFHRPRIHEIFGLDAELGLTNMILDNVGLSALVCEVTSPVTTIQVLPAGPLPPSPADFIVSDGFMHTVEELKRQYDLVVFDAPPVLPVSDAMALARQCDATIVTALAGGTSVDELTRTITSLEQAGGRILGVVLIGTKSVTNYSYSSYSNAGGVKRRKRGRRLGSGRGHSSLPGLVSFQPKSGHAKTNGQHEPVGEKPSVKSGSR